MLHTQCRIALNAKSCQDLPLEPRRCIPGGCSTEQYNLSKYICCMLHPAIIHLGEKVKVRNQIVPMSVSSSYPSGVAGRQDVQLHLTVRSSAEAQEPVRPTHQTPALGEKPLWSGFQLIHEHQLTGRHETPRCPACTAPSRNMCFHLGQIPQHTQWKSGGVKVWNSLNKTLCLSLASCTGLISSVDCFLENILAFVTPNPHLYSLHLWQHIYET